MRKLLIEVTDEEYEKIKAGALENKPIVGDISSGDLITILKERAKDVDKSYFYDSSKMRNVDVYKFSIESEGYEYVCTIAQNRK